MNGFAIMFFAVFTEWKINIFNATTINSLFNVKVIMYIYFNVNLLSAKLKVDWKLFSGSTIFL